MFSSLGEDTIHSLGDLHHNSFWGIMTLQKPVGPVMLKLIVLSGWLKLNALISGEFVIMFMWNFCFCQVAMTFVNGLISGYLSHFE